MLKAPCLLLALLVFAAAPMVHAQPGDAPANTSSMLLVQSDNPFELNNATVDDLMNRCFFSQEDAERILELRDSMGGFQSWDDLKELNLTPAQLSILASEATISGIRTDCNC